MKMIHGGDIYHYKDIIDFSANINPLGTPKSVMQAIAKNMGDVKHYPDINCEKLRKGIGKFHNVDKGRIICGNGAADLIYRFVFALKPKKGLILAPCFAEYEQALRAAGAQVKHYKLDRKTFCLGEGFLKALTEDLDMVFLCNPNNPTGKTIEPELLRKIVMTCKKRNIWLMLDECFLDFLEDEESISLLQVASNNDSLFVLRAFTKMYAVPGIRLGYGVCANKKLLEQMALAGPPWNVSVLAQVAGVQALHETQFVRQTKAYVREEKKYICHELEQLGILYWNGEANYIFFRAQEGLKEQLIPYGILIRDCGNYHNLDSTYYRIAVRKREDNEKLIASLEEIKTNQARTGGIVWQNQL